ncbi:MAG: T9SS type A sorting domain-containing protein [Bacteroidota bacterium]
MKYLGLLLCFTIAVNAQDGSADINWGNLPFNELNFKGCNGNISGALDRNEVYAIAEQADGKFLIGGGFFNYNTFVSPKIVRTLADGTFDPSFQSPLLQVFAGVVRSIVPLQDGRILITGQFDFECGSGSACQTSVMVLNNDGTINRNVTEVSGNIVYDSHLLPDGKILVAGSVYNQLSISNRGITRLNNDGTLDTTFESYPNDGLATFFDSDIRDIELQSDGKIIVAGNLDFYNGTSVENIVRLLPDSTLDPTFNAPEFDDDIFSVELLQDDTIYVGGPFDEIDNNTQRFLAKLTSNGALDPSFQPDITTSFRVVEDIQALPNGKLMIAGNFTTVEFEPVQYVARLEADGALDTTYFSGLSPSQRVRTIYLKTDGKLLFGGDFTRYQQSDRGYIAQTEPDGILDASFNPGLGANDRIDRLVLQPDGKIVAVGQFQEFNGFTRFGIARLFNDGTVDPSFDAGLTFAYRNASDIVLQPDGKMIVSGSFISSAFSDINTTPAVVRLNSDGSLDNTFTNAFDDSETVTKLGIQADGKIITNTGTTNLSYRLNTDGTEDLSFIGPSFIDIRGIAIQPNGKVIFTGQFDSYLGNPSRDIVRVNPDGSFDSTFDIGTGSSNYLRQALVRPDGKILVGGNINSFNGVSLGNIFQLNSDGSIDTSFTDTDLVSEVIDIKLAPDNKILAAGRIFSIDGHSTDGIVRLNADGSVDTSFSISNIDDDRVVGSMAVDSEGELIFGGSFTNVNVLQRGRISRALLNPTTNDADNDGVAFALDEDPNNPFICRDLDNDGCDDCSQTGADGSGGNSVNDGDDLDNDGLCDLGDDDIDGDNFSNQEEIDCGSNPLDANETCDSLNILNNDTVDFKVYPNPTKGEINLESDEVIEDLSIFDSRGRILLSINPNLKDVNVSLKHLNTGIYFLKIKTFSGVGSKKIMLKQ